MDAYYYSFAEQLRVTFLLEKEGLLEQGEWLKRVQLDSKYFFGNPYGMALWRGYSQFAVLPNEHKISIDKKLAMTLR